MLSYLSTSARHVARLRAARPHERRMTRPMAAFLRGLGICAADGSLIPGRAGDTPRMSACLPPGPLKLLPG
eukprot:tig00020801_g13924.t1